MPHWSIEAAKTHCKNGHEFSASNTGTDHRGNRLCKKCSSERVKKKQARIRAELQKYKLDRGCDNCGYNRCSDVLSFHHRDPKEKIAQVPNMLTCSKEKRELEIAKCDLLCANCHYEEHARIRNGKAYGQR